jgi:hypothetical protein
LKISIGDKNKFNNASIGHRFGSNDHVPAKNNFAERHPIIISSVVSLIVGFILLFSYWDKVINWIEGFFK